MKTYLGLDSSTQGLKAVLIDGTGVIAEEAVHFGNDLPAYHSPNGFLADEDPQLIHADPLMWLDALDLLFDRMRKRGLHLDRIHGISGSGQQHGSVYLNRDFDGKLASLDPKLPLSQQLRATLSRPTAPIWLDHSTQEECRILTERFGRRLQTLTGSAAAERFTAPQIMKFARREPERWRNTARVHLVSSFLCSVLCGRSAPVDCGDGAGMNLLNLQTLSWEPEIVDFTAPGLAEKLPPVVRPGAVAGTLSPYFCKYGFTAGIPVVVWSGDNPCSLVGTGCSGIGTVGISLGTSDTLFAPMSEFRTDPAGCGHIFGNPAGGFLALICFANGSLARERVRAEFNFSREEWEEAVKQPRPAGGRIMLPYFEPECTPPIPVPRVRCNFDRAANPAETIRALLETQILSMKHHSSWMKLKIDRIRVTGGASRSLGLCQIIADIFQARIERTESANAAGLGAAMCAAGAIEKIPVAELSGIYCRSGETVHPIPENAVGYEKQMERFLSFLKKETSGGTVKECPV